MPNEVSTPVDLPPFDFQLRGPVYNPLDWYWVMDDGRIYSSAREAMISADDQQYLIWREGRAPTNWPRDADGKQTVEALREVVAAFVKQVPE
ncbi:hypothetical protein ABIF65_005991 [Bradyrhizobium japonicum]|uniref:hypothetical protein n=1 Tax=Bradyrhizobium TaxID=374 RepID=UPI000411F972|nr:MULTISPECIES: hypothetical protein [Bradyrhizobium]MBR1002716.1 hypothetical protein [Bradyrhizobium liaoningense]MBR1025601.1 hypothetical protein [Bradyrhizobium liaoningense]MBR1068316.1 hypothetical protein [Bradyrhizobium liaoningense]MCP1744329.1 hypothetical protein [Bradyrhizobium japonicum]MCP1782608.1 hypothetical protein [Bradyrhizobium japonicum]